MNLFYAKNILFSSSKFLKHSSSLAYHHQKLKNLQISYYFTSKPTLQQLLKNNMENTQKNLQQQINADELQKEKNKPDTSNTSEQSQKNSNGDIKSQPKKTCLKSRIPEHQVPAIRSDCVVMDNFEIIMRNNLKWSEENLQKDPEYFKRMKYTQTPDFLWIGCSDSRVPANQVVGLKPGELFVHRNIANQAPLSDINVLAVIQYSVQVLQVKDIIVCGHYGCGGIKACFKKHDHGSLQSWLSYIRDLKARYRKQFIGHTQQQCEDLLVQLNVKQQVYNISRAPIVQKMWKQGKQLRIHGLVYRLEDGILKDLDLTIDSLDLLPEQYRIY